MKVIALAVEMDMHDGASLSEAIFRASVRLRQLAERVPLHDDSWNGRFDELSGKITLRGDVEPRSEGVEL